MREGAEGGDVSGGYGEAHEKRQLHEGAAMSLCQEKSRSGSLLDQRCFRIKKASVPNVMTDLGLMGYITMIFCVSPQPRTMYAPACGTGMRRSVPLYRRRPVRS